MRLLFAAAAGVLLAAFVGGLTAAQASPTIPTAPPSGAVNATRAKAHQLETEIATDNERVQIDGERYDEEETTLELANARLAKLKADIARERGRITTAKVRVRETAVADYVDGSGLASELGEFFTGKVVDVGTFGAYAQVATHSLQSAVDTYVAAEQRLTTSETAAGAARATAEDALGRAAVAREAATAATDQTTAALHEVNGELAHYIAEQEAHDAAVAQARREAAEAEAAASVAATIAAADPSAATEADAAAIAASSVDAPTLTPAGSNALGNAAVAAAESFLGIPYVWGGASRAGVDCSGLTMLSWRSAGVALLHSAWYQYETTRHISLKQLEPGDLLFYHFPNDGADPVTHVAMYVGSGPFGTQTVIQAPETGETVSYASFYIDGFVGAGRPAAAMSGAATTTAAPSTTTSAS